MPSKSKKQKSSSNKSKSTPKKSKSPSKNSKSSSKQKKHDLDIFGFSFPSFIKRSVPLLFVTLALAHIAASVLFAFLQEKVTKIEGFRYARFMATIELFTFALCAFIELRLTGGKQGKISSPRAPIYTYLLLSIFTFGGMFCTNSGLDYISYPTRIIFKGAKPVPTMIMEYLYVGKIFTKIEITSVFILVIGIILFSSADAYSKTSVSDKDPTWGYIFMTFGVIFDSFTSNFEKKIIFKKYSATHCEAMFFASCFGFIYSLITLMLTDPDMLYDGFYWFMTTPNAILWLMCSSIGAYTSVVFVLLLIKVYSTTYAECVKGVRKVCSISFSYLFLGKDKTFGMYHFCGVTCFILSSATTVYTKSVKTKVM